MIFPEDASKVGYAVDNLFYLALILTSIAFFLVVGVLVYFLIRYRSRKNHEAYYTKGNSPKAIVFTLTLAAIVFLVIDVNLAIQDHHAWELTWGKPPVGNVLQVQVMPQQFAWNIRYAGPDGEFATADDITTINQMHVPIDRPIIVSLKSKDVIHSFFLPNFRIKQDAVPGMVTSLSFAAAKMGNYDIACAEHCGLGHYRMRGILTVDSEENFQKWLGEQAVNPPDSSWGWKW